VMRSFFCFVSREDLDFLPDLDLLFLTNSTPFLHNLSILSFELLTRKLLCLLKVFKSKVIRSGEPEILFLRLDSFLSIKISSFFFVCELKY
jgi:hypothetical protein